MSVLLFEKIDGVGKITLNRPEAFNSFNSELAKALFDALSTCEKDPEVRCIYLTGNGRAFSAGQDIKEITHPDYTGDVKRIVPENYNPIVNKIYDIPKPIVCAVNGVAAGAGANIALLCDVTLATESASFIKHLARSV